MTLGPKCSECMQRGWHKMSCDIGRRHRLRLRAELDALRGDEPQASPVDLSPPSPCAVPETPDCSAGNSGSDCGGGSE